GSRDRGEPEARPLLEKDGERGQRGNRLGDDDYRHALGERWGHALPENRPRPARDRVRSEVVPVDARARDRHEERPGMDGARIDRDAGELDVLSDRKRRTRRRSDVGEREIHGRAFTTPDAPTRI